MLEVEILQGRKIGRAEIVEIQTLIEAKPQWSRWRLSGVLARRLEWYSASGQLKDMGVPMLDVFSAQNPHFGCVGVTC